MNTWVRTDIHGTYMHTFTPKRKQTEKNLKFLEHMILLLEMHIRAFAEAQKTRFRLFPGALHYFATKLGITLMSNNKCFSKL